MIYELTIVAHPVNAEGLMGRVEKAVHDANASSIKIEKLGKKKLAYPIKKQTEAVYAVFNFEAEGSAVKGVWDKLRLEQEDLLRFIFLSKPPKKAKRKHKRKEEVTAVAKEEKKVPKVTVVTKNVSKVSQSKAVRPLDEKATKKVDAKGKIAVASKAKVKAPKVSKVSKGTKATGDKK